MLIIVQILDKTLDRINFIADPGLKVKLIQRAENANLTLSQYINKALKKFLDVIE